MLVTLALAVVVTTTAWLGGGVLLGGGGLIARERDLDDAVRVQLAKIGWRPPTSPALRDVAAKLDRERRVALLHTDSLFELPLPYGAVRGGPATEEQLVTASVVIADELRLLPAAFLGAIGLWRVLLCANLSEDGRAIPSLPNYRHTLILDVADASPAYLRRLLQHEVFHFFDLADDGMLVNDMRWLALNPTGHEYGYGGRSMRDPAATMLSEAPGFVTRYATSALEEDKAELFSLMMTHPAAMRQRAARDTFVAAKMARIIELTSAMTPELDRGFWLRLEALRRR
jgi:hypothetical protein